MKCFYFIFIASFLVIYKETSARSSSSEESDSDEDDVSSSTSTDHVTAHAPIPPQVSKPINYGGFEQIPTTKTVTHLPADSRVNNNFFTRNNNIYNNGGHYVQELTIVGLGVNDVFKYLSETNDPPKTLSFGDFLSVTDPNGNFKLFSNSWGKLWVSVNGHYFERTYNTANGQTEITSTPITAAAYEAAKDKSTHQSGGGKISNYGNTYTM